MSRLGFILPSVNTVLEQDLRRHLPADVSAHVARVRLTSTRRKDVLKVLDDAPGAAGLLGDAGIDALGFCCTAGSLIGGPGSSERLVVRLQDEARAPATTTTLALFAAFRALTIRRVVLVSPFGAVPNREEAEFIEASGFEVTGIAALDIDDPRECPCVTPAALRELAMGADHGGADGIFLSCANVAGFDAVAELEKASGLPVVSSNQVVVWAALSLAGHPGRPSGGGRLFDHQAQEFLQ